MLQIAALKMTAYFLPDDRAVAVPAIKALIDQAKQSIRIICYGFDHPVLLAALGAAYQRGVDVKLILDLTQSKGTAEARALKQFMTVIPPQNFHIGTSTLDAIIHDKVCVIDGVYVIEGSFNWSPSAEKQMNTLNVLENADYNAYLRRTFDTQWAWLAAHEAKNQPTGAAA